MRCRSMLCTLPLIMPTVFLFGSFASASDIYPSKAIQIIIAFAPGGPTDFILRPVAQKLSEALGQPVVVVNRPGAGGNTGAEFVVKAAPDGYTLLQGAKSQLTNNPSLYARMPFDPLKDLAPISLIAASPAAVVVHPSLPVSSFAQLIAFAKAAPRALTYSSAGVGTGNHLVGILFNLLTHVSTLHIPYKGGGPALTAVVSGEVNLTFISLSVALPHIKTKRLRALALCALERSPLQPELPTTAELGMPELESSSGSGLLAPAGTPKTIIDKLHSEITKILSVPEVRNRMIGEGLQVIGSTPDGFRSVLLEETERWSKVIKAAKIPME